MNLSGTAFITAVRDGEDSVLYRLVTSVDAVRFDKDFLPQTDGVTVTAYRVTGSNPQELTADMSIRYRKIKGSVGGYVSKGKVSSFTIPIYEPDFDTIEITGLIDGKEVARKTVSAIVDGEDAVVYKIATSVDTIRFDSGNVPQPNNIVVTAHKTVGEGAPVATNEMVLRYRKIKDSSGNYVNKGSVSQFSIPISALDFDTIEVTGLINGTEVARKTISSVVDGKQGDPGALFYPYGSWNKLSNYTRTEELCPFVLYDTGNPLTDSYYYPAEKGTIEGGSSNLPPNQDNRWKVMNQFEAVYTKVLFAKFALLGSAVFYDDYMFSQHGLDKSGNESFQYQNFNPSYPNGGNFQPNTWMNLKTGESFFRNTEIDGTIKSASGEIGGFEISEGGLYRSGGYPMGEMVDGRISSQMELCKFGAIFNWRLGSRIWEVDARPDNDYIMRIGSLGYGVGSGLIELVGGHIAGLALKTQVSKGGNISEGVGFLQADVTTSDPTFYLPANPVSGQQVFVCTRNRSVTVDGNGHKIFRTGSLFDSTNVGGYGRIILFMYNGEDWAYGHLNN